MGIIVRKGVNILLRLCESSDAKFIMDLRQNNGEYLSKNSLNINLQEDWIARYKERESLGQEFYYIINNEGFDVGCVRLYNIDSVKKTFTFGSFIVDKDLSTNKLNALDSMVTVLSFAFNELSLKICRFDCRKENKKANNFYKRFGARLIKSDNMDLFYEYDLNDFNNNISKYLRSLS